MLYLQRYFSLKIISIIFLFFSLAKGQGEQVVQTEDVLDGFTSSLGDLGKKGSLNNLEDRSMFLGFLSEIKEDLNSEKNKLEEFEGSFCNLCNLLNESDSSKTEKLKSLATNVQDLNCLIDSSDSVIGLDEELKDKILLLGDLIRLFINNDGIDLEKLGQDHQSVVQAIEAIAQFLNSDAYNKQKIEKQIIDKEVVVDTEHNEVVEQLDPEYINTEDFNLDYLNTQEVDVSDLQDSEYIHNLIDVESDSSEDNIDQEESESIIKEEIVVLENTDIDNTIHENEISSEELAADQNKKAKKKKKNGKLINISMQDVVNAGKVAAQALHNVGDYRLGGYPIQFVHQLLRHMDKVYNK